MNKNLYQKLCNVPELVTPADIPRDWNTQEGDSWAEFLAQNDLRVMATIPVDVADHLALLALAEYAVGTGMYFPSIWMLNVSKTYKSMLLDLFLSAPCSSASAENKLFDSMGCLLTGNKYIKDDGTLKSIVGSLVEIFLQPSKSTTIQRERILEILPDIVANTNCPSGLLRQFLVAPHGLPVDKESSLFQICRSLAASNSILPDDVAAELLALHLADDESWHVAMCAKTPFLKQTAAAWHTVVQQKDPEFIRIAWEQTDKIRQTATLITRLTNGG